MKGAVFIAFNQMVEERLGIDCWENLLSRVKPVSEGIYTSVEGYDDDELFSLVAELSNLSNIPVPTLVESFGEYLFNVLNAKYPIFSEQQVSFFDFIESIDEVIHKEVRKLYESPSLPSLSCERVDDKTLIIHYQSPRKLCVLAEGLIRGAAVHYQVKYQLFHEQCMHDGNDYCIMKVTLDS